MAACWAIALAAKEPELNAPGVILFPTAAPDASDAKQPARSEAAVLQFANSDMFLYRDALKLDLWISL